MQRPVSSVLAVEGGQSEYRVAVDKAYLSLPQEGAGQTQQRPRLHHLLVPSSSSTLYEGRLNKYN